MTRKGYKKRRWRILLHSKPQPQKRCTRRSSTTNATTIITRSGASRACTLLMTRFYRISRSNSIALHFTKDSHLDGHRNDLQETLFVSQSFYAIFRWPFLRPGSLMRSAGIEASLRRHCGVIEATASSSEGMVISTRNSRSAIKCTPASVFIERENREAARVLEKSP